MENQTKPTVGAKAYELLSQKPESMYVMDIQQEADKKVSQVLEKIIREHKNYATKYFIRIVLKKEPLMENTIRRYFFVGKDRPVPDFDTSVFSYDNEKEELYYHWSIPDPTSCHYLLTHESVLPDEEKPLFEMVHKFSAGILQ